MHNLHDHHPPVRLDTDHKGILHGKPIDQTLLQTPDLPALIVLAEGERLDLSDQAGQAYFYAHPDGLDVAWQGVALGPEAYAQGPIALRGPVPVVSDRDANGHLFGALVFLPSFLIFAGTALGLAYVLESVQQTPPWLGVAIIAGCLIAIACTFGTLFALERVVRGYAYSRSRTTTLAHRLSKPIQVSFPAGFAPASADSPTTPSLSPQTLVVGFFETIKDHTPTHAQFLPHGQTLELPKGAIVRLANRSADTVQWYDCAPTTSTLTGPLIYDGWRTHQEGPFLVHQQRHKRSEVMFTAGVCNFFIVLFSGLATLLGMPEEAHATLLLQPLFWTLAILGVAIVAVLTARTHSRLLDPTRIKSTVPPQRHLITTPAHTTL